MINFSFFDIIPFITLLGLELALGVDNIVAIYAITNKLHPKSRQLFARKLGVGLAAIGRILLLYLLTFLKHANNILFSFYEYNVSWSNLIYFIGGIYLLYKGISEIYHYMIEIPEEKGQHQSKKVNFFGVLLQMLMIDIALSLDSIITAVALSDNIVIIISVIIISVLLMIFFVNPVCKFIDTYPEAKIIALVFLSLLGLLLILESLNIKINHNYLYSALVFSLTVMTLNIIKSSKKKKRR